MHLNTSSGIGTGRMDRSSCGVCTLWAFATGRSPGDHPGKMLTLRDPLARSDGSAWTTPSCSGTRTCAGSYAPMLPTIMNRGPIDPWTRTPRSVAPSSTWAASYLRPSSAAFITTIAESSFQYTHLLVTDQNLILQTAFHGWNVANA